MATRAEEILERVERLEERVDRMLRENRSTNLKRGLAGNLDYIFSIGIITPENPMGNKLSAKENEALRADFKKTLDKLHIVQYTKVSGQYGSEEKSFMLINVNLEDMKYLGKKYDQESFIFGTKYFDTERNGFYMEYGYFEKPADGDYKELEVARGISLQSDAEDFFTRFKNYKFNMPFLFEANDLNEANKLVEGIVSYRESNELDDLVGKIYLNVTDGSKTLRHRSKNRYFIYESKEMRAKREASVI